MRTLEECRREIDGIDGKLLPLFCRRMEVAAEIAARKRAEGLPVLNAVREEAIRERIGRAAAPGMAEYAEALYERIFALSRDYQTAMMRPEGRG